MKKLIVWQLVVTLITLGVYFGLLEMIDNAQIAITVLMVAFAVCAVIAVAFAVGASASSLNAVLTALIVAFAAVMAAAAAGVAVTTTAVAAAAGVAVAVIAAAVMAAKQKISWVKVGFAVLIQSALVFFLIFRTLP